MKKNGPTQLWLLVFAFWGLFLSGVLASFIGTPGIIQAVRLKSLLETKQLQNFQIQSELQKLRLEASLLEHSKVAQQREIRKILGYTAPDEIIFDFSKSLAQ